MGKGKFVFLVVALAACSVERNGTVSQAVAGPGGVTVTARDTGQLAVSWAADPAASQYRVFQSAGGGSFGLVATVFDSSGSAPSTSYIAEVAAGGYCYAVSSAYADGSTSELSAPACASTLSDDGAPAVHTIAIPLAPTGQAAALDGTMIAPFASTRAGQLNAMFIAGFTLPRGSHVLRVRASVADGASCRLAATLGLAGAGGAGVFALGPASDGSGNVQTIVSPPLDVAVSAANAYYAALRTVAGTAACSVFWIEVDYQG